MNTLSSSASSSENSESESEDSSSDDGSSSSSSDSGSDGGDEQGAEQSMIPDIISLLTVARPIRPLPRRRREQTDKAPVKKPGIMEVLSTDSEERR
jgi:hypothetical protein